MCYSILEIPQFHNYDLEHISSPVKVSELKKLLLKTEYDVQETAFLVKDFTEGFFIKVQRSMVMQRPVQEYSFCFWGWQQQRNVI